MRLDATALFFVLCALLSAKVGYAFELSSRDFEGTRYIVCKVDLTQDDLRLFYRTPDNRRIGNFSAIPRQLSAGKSLAFAMNAGMFHSDFSAVGLCITYQKLWSPLNLNPGKGNFFLKPNGVFYLLEGKGSIIDSTKFDVSLYPRIQLATQSGPLLVEHGIIHPAFTPKPTSSVIRNGVELQSDTVVYFAISEGPVGFHSFSRFFRDELLCPDALYLDGIISSIYAPSLGRQNDARSTLGPIFAVIADDTTAGSLPPAGK